MPTITLCRATAVLCVAAIGAAIAVRTAWAEEPLLAITAGVITRPPTGWVNFCAELPQECKAGNLTAREIVLSQRAWNDLARINAEVNASIRPKTDLEHYGTLEKWTYPSDGYGDCEDYVLLKRRMLMEAGWPREALLITVVYRDSFEAHAVLLAKTDRGEFILDNRTPAILLRTETGYRFLKRQSQTDPNIWISLDDPSPTAATATAR
jgi:predicted transglutaminase-like cysteine proteinase